MTTRTITDHRINGLNDALEIRTTGEPGTGGAPTDYIIQLNSRIGRAWVLNFQNGPIATPDDFNGLTNEALLAVLIDRMRGFQSGKFACRENAVALTKMEEALMWLQKRTLDRVRRGVEGSLKP